MPDTKDRPRCKHCKVCNDCAYCGDCKCAMPFCDTCERILIQPQEEYEDVLCKDCYTIYWPSNYF